MKKLWKLSYFRFWCTTYIDSFIEAVTWEDALKQLLEIAGSKKHCIRSVFSPDKETRPDHHAVSIAESN